MPTQLIVNCETVTLLQTQFIKMKPYLVGAGPEDLPGMHVIVGIGVIRLCEMFGRGESFIPALNIIDKESIGCCAATSNQLNQESISGLPLDPEICIFADALITH